MLEGYEPRKAMEKLAKMARDAVDDFRLEHSVEPNCLLMGPEVQEAITRNGAKLGEENCKEWMRFDEKTRQWHFFGMHVVGIARGRTLGAGLMHPPEVLVNGGGEGLKAKH